MAVQRHIKATSKLLASALDGDMHPAGEYRFLIKSDDRLGDLLTV